MAFYKPRSHRGGLCALLVIAMAGVTGEAAGVDFNGCDPTLTIAFMVPPAIVVIADSQGRRDGVDPSKPLSADGEGTVLQEIPNSWAMQDNISSDAPGDHGARNPTSHWDAELASKTRQTYTITLIGLRDGVTPFWLTGTSACSSPWDPSIDRFVIPQRNLDVLVTAGATRTLLFDYDPTKNSLKTTRVVRPEDVALSVAAACGVTPTVCPPECSQAQIASCTICLGTGKTYEQCKAEGLCPTGIRSQPFLIAPEGVCASLKAKASAAAAAMKRGNKAAARESLKAFLAEVKAQTGKHVMEPAATILREEAEAALQQLDTKARKGKGR